jgi:hypothetical protein
VPQGLSGRQEGDRAPGVGRVAAVTAVVGVQRLRLVTAEDSADVRRDVEKRRFRIDQWPPDRPDPKHDRLDAAALKTVRGDRVDGLLERDDQVRQRLGGQRELLAPGDHTALPRRRINGWRLGYDAVLAMRLAFDEPSVLRSRTIGESWLAVAGRIAASGVSSLYDGLPIRELSLVTLVVARPDPDDEIITTHADPERVGGGAVQAPIDVGGPLKDVIEAPSLDIVRQLDARTNIGFAVESAAAADSEPDVHEDYVSAYDLGRFAESARFVGHCPEQNPVLRGLLP